MLKVRITAIRQTIYNDLIAQYENPMSAMISCNDGFRPFSFYIEVIEEPESSQQTVKMYDASHKLNETWQYD